MRSRLARTIALAPDINRTHPPAAVDRLGDVSLESFPGTLKPGAVKPAAIRPGNSKPRSGVSQPTNRMSGQEGNGSKKRPPTIEPRPHQAATTTTTPA